VAERADHHGHLREHRHHRRGEAILRATASGTREEREQWGDITRMVLATAPHDPSVADSLAAVTGSYRHGMMLIARRLGLTAVAPVIHGDSSDTAGAQAMVFMPPAPWCERWSRAR
jgi:hypothetical protein